jgi:hypothetical protein
MIYFLSLAEASNAAANGNNQMIEDENDSLEENLQFKVKALKSVSVQTNLGSNNNGL